MFYTQVKILILKHRKLIYHNVKYSCVRYTQLDLSGTVRFMIDFSTLKFSTFWHCGIIAL